MQAECIFTASELTVILKNAAETGTSNVVGEIVKRVHADLSRLQGTPGAGLLLYKQVPNGLGAQITGRIEALRLGLAFNRTTLFLHLNDPPYGQIFEQMAPAWCPAIAENPPDIKFEASQDDPVIVFDPLRHDIRPFAQITHERLSNQGIDSKPALLTAAILSWMRPLPDIAAMIEEKSEALAIGASTLGVHFRRGDKSVESAYVPASAINDAIATLYKNWNFETVFLASDDPCASDQIQVPPGVRLIFDQDEERFNNANHKMLFSRPDLRDQEARVAFLNIALLTKCGGIVGQDNAHFATLAADVITARDGSEAHVILIDGFLRERNSRTIRTIALAKRHTRAIGRKLFPFMTAVARRKSFAEKLK